MLQNVRPTGVKFTLALRSQPLWCKEWVFQARPGLEIWVGGGSSQLQDGAAGEGGLKKVGGLCPKCPEGPGSFRTEVRCQGFEWISCFPSAHWAVSELSPELSRVWSSAIKLILSLVLKSSDGQPVCFEHQWLFSASLSTGFLIKKTEIAIQRTSVWGHIKSTATSDNKQNDILI